MVVGLNVFRRLQIYCQMMCLHAKNTFLERKNQIIARNILWLV